MGKNRKIIASLGIWLGCLLVVWAALRVGGGRMAISQTALWQDYERALQRRIFPAGAQLQGNERGIRQRCLSFLVPLLSGEAENLLTETGAVQTGRTGLFGMVIGAGQGDQPGRTDSTGRTGLFGMVIGAGQGSQPGRTDQPAQPDQPDQPGPLGMTADGMAQADPEKSDLYIRMEQEQRAARGDQPGLFGMGSEAGQGSQPNRTDQPAQPDQPGPLGMTADDTAQTDPETAQRFLTFTPHERVRELSQEEMGSYEALLKNFYTIDPSTMAGSNQLRAETFLARDLSIAKDSDGPQILIYHTHSQEGFADSVPGDAQTTIVGVGEELARILRQDYGYEVLHHTGEYDKKTRDDAYSRALPEIEQILSDHPSIQVVIDLHRDEMPEGVRLVQEVGGKETARFMFFNGLSRTRQTGNLDYLYNVYQEENLAFSFQMQKAALEYYPGLTRKIYLKGYRYNMHLCPRSLLIELGAQNNTLEEAMNACGPLAHLLDLVLSPEDS